AAARHAVDRPLGGRVAPGHRERVVPVPLGLRHEQHLAVVRKAHRADLVFGRVDGLDALVRVRRVPVDELVEAGRLRLAVLLIGLTAGTAAALPLRGRIALQIPHAGAVDAPAERAPRGVIAAPAAATTTAAAAALV